MFFDNPKNRSASPIINHHGNPIIMAESKYSDLSERIEKTLATTVKIERIDHLPKGVGVTVKKAYDSMVGAINIDLRNLRTLSGSNRELGIRVSSACYGAILRVMRSNNLIGTHVAADSVTALYTVSDDSEVGALISMAASLSSLIRLLNIHYSKKNLNNVTAGIGVSVSRGLRIGFRRPGGCRGSVWASQCIGEAKELSKLGSINSEGNTTNPSSCPRHCTTSSATETYPTTSSLYSLSPRYTTATTGTYAAPSWNNGSRATSTIRKGIDMKQLRRIYLSCDYRNDGEYRDRFLALNRYWNIFSDAYMRNDVCEPAPSDRKTLLKEIRRSQIRDATVLVLLCGAHTRYCPLVDREICSAMTENYEYSRLGILVISLPDSGNGECLCKEDSVLLDRYRRCDRPDTMYELSRLLPGMPMRIIDSILKGCPISVVSWEHVVEDHDRMVELVNRAYLRRSLMDYDNRCQLKTVIPSRGSDTGTGARL